MPVPSDGSLRIVMADDNYLVREGARRLLEDSGDVIVEAAVGSAPLSESGNCHFPAATYICQ